MLENELGWDIFREQQQNYENLMLEFVDKQDWFKEIESIRIKQSLHPKNILMDVEQPEDLEKPSTASGNNAAGYIINGKFHTKEDIQEL